jgi:hypothetical protein
MKVEFIKSCSGCHHAKWIVSDNCYRCNKDVQHREVMGEVGGEKINVNGQPLWCPLPDIEDILYNACSREQPKEATNENPAQ